MMAHRSAGLLALSAALLLGGTGNAQTPEVLRKLHDLRHEGHVGGIFFAAAEDEIVTCAWDGTIRFWDATRGTAKEILTINVAVRGGKSDGKEIVPQLSAAIPWEKNRWLFRMPSDMGLGVWDREKRKFGPYYTFPNRSILAHYVRGPEAVLVLMNDERSFPVIWDVKSRRIVRRLIGLKSPATLAHFSPDGRRVLTHSTGDQTTVLWDTTTGKLLGRLVNAENIASFAFSPDGKRIITGGNVVRIWDAPTGKEVGLIELPEGAVVASGGRGIAFSPDGKKVLVLTHKGQTDCTLRLFDLALGKLVARADRKYESLEREGDFGVMFYPDGKRAITYGGLSTANTPQAKIVTVWEMPSAEEKN